MSPRRWLFLVLGVCGMITLVVLSTSLIAGTITISKIRETQNTNTVRNKEQASTLQIIKDCTTPKMPCFERAKAAQAAQTGDINQVTILAAACATQLPQPTSATRVYRCVMEELRKENHG